MKRLFFILLFFTTMNVFSQDYHTFSGVVKDSQTGEFINGVDIFVKENTTATLSSNTGSFFMFLNKGTYNIKISGEGYKTEIMTLSLTEDKYLEISLTPSENNKRKSASWVKKKTSNQGKEIVQHSQNIDPS